MATIRTQVTDLLDAHKIDYRVTGFVHGAVAPLALPAGMPVLFDEAIPAAGW